MLTYVRHVAPCVHGRIVAPLFTNSTTCTQPHAWINGWLMHGYASALGRHHAPEHIPREAGTLCIRVTPLLLLKDSEFFGIFYCFSNFGTILIIKRFRILRNLLLFFEFRYYPFYYYYYLFSVPPFARENLRNRNAFSHQTSHTCRPSPLIVHLIFFERIRITILDLEPNPCFQIFLNISKPYHQIFNCNTSKRRSGQQLPFIFFELRDPTCL